MLKPRKARKITVELADFDDPKRPTTGIENLQIHVRRSEVWHQRVKPLFNIGGLVKYPIGEGLAGSIGRRCGSGTVLKASRSPAGRTNQRAVILPDEPAELGLIDLK